MITLVSNRCVPAFDDVRTPAFAASGQEAARRTIDARGEPRVVRPLAVVAHRIDPTRQVGPEDGLTPALRGDVLREHSVQRSYGLRSWKSAVGANGKWCGFCFANCDNPGKVEASCM